MSLKLIKMNRGGKDAAAASGIRLISMRSSFFTGKGVIVAVLAAGGTAFALHKTALGIVLITLAVISAISGKWALDALKDVVFEAEGSRYTMFPGDDFEIRLRIRNNKAVPIMWAEAAFPVEEDSPVRPLREDDIFEPDGLTKADEDLPDCPMLKVKTAFIMPWQRSEISVPMTAVRRGLFEYDRIRLYSGDGLGLAQTGMTVSAPDRTFAVFPRPADVRMELFTRTQWMISGGSRGYTEDTTLIRGTREYRTGDRWKSINWRMTARGLPLTVNLPEMILPQSSHFILDGESFSGTDPQNEQFEQMLSIVAGIMMRMDRMGLPFGLTLPDSLRGRGETYADGTECGKMLYSLAAYERKSPVYDEDGNCLPARSVFDKRKLCSVMASSGAVYYFTKRTELADRDIIRMAGSRLTLITAEQPSAEDALRLGCRTAGFGAVVRQVKQN